MAKIHVLDSQVAELIAAGEVVERPASIVKELVENAVDAGARRITVEIQGGGIRYIRVADDGCGIAREDVRTAFVRHATSKVLTKEDLERIVTLGFRGEALASVAAVGRVELLTRTAAETEGTYYRIEGSLEQVLEDAGCAVGTTIIVRDLFYNTPARMKFLKKDIAEGNAVAAAVDRAALTHPHICFQLFRDGQRRLLTPGKGDLYGAVYAVYGGDFAGSLIPVREALDRLPVTGFICEPGAGRATRSMQHFSVNARYIRSRTCTAALEEAYKNRLQTGHYPAGVLDIRVPWEKVDVNVHPAKIEVRFSDEKAVFDAVYSACRMTLEQADRTPPGAQSRRSAPGLFALGDFDHAQAQQRLEGSRALFKPDAGGAFVPPPAPVPIPPLRTGGDTLLAVAEQPESRDPRPGGNRAVSGWSAPRRRAAGPCAVQDSAFAGGARERRSYGVGNFGQCAR
jgi:DNA mismatch repair protein MutL